MQSIITFQSDWHFHKPVTELYVKIQGYISIRYAINQRVNAKKNSIWDYAFTDGLVEKRRDSIWSYISSVLIMNIVSKMCQTPIT